MRKKRSCTVISGVVFAALLLQCFKENANLVNAQEVEGLHQYVVSAEDTKSYATIKEEIEDSIVAESPVLDRNNVMVAELTETELEEISDKGVLVEEDITFLASDVDNVESDEVYTEKMESVMSQKQEVLKKKEQIYAKIREKEKTIEDVEKEYDWNLQAINTDELTITEEVSKNKVKVAVLDSGVDYVSGINLKGYVNFVEEEQNNLPIFQDMTGHGTGIAGVIAGNGENGIYGIAPDVDLYSVKVLDENNSAPLNRVVQGIYWCIENDIDIINMSFGTANYSKTLEQAVQAAYEEGILMVGAAGNENAEVEYPAAFKEVMAVAATNPASGISDFSNMGEELEIAAPGEKIRTTGFFNGSIVVSGTSMAVPHVVGVAARLWKRDLTKTNEFIRQLIRYSSKELADTDECGLLDAEFAMKMYTSFEKEYENGGVLEAEVLPQNMGKVEKFVDVYEDSAYVEGRWNSDGHKGAIASDIVGFTASEIKIIKKGIVYPDNVGYMESGKKNPYWHGKWKWIDQTDGSKEKMVNYVAAFEMITQTALNDCDTSFFNSYKDIAGMSNAVFTEIEKDITMLNQKFDTILGDSNTKKNQKYFLFACGLHTMTDIFAHSTTKADGYLIAHDDDTTHPDSISYYPRRYKVAVKATEYSLKMLQENTFGDGYEIKQALEDEYTSDATFKIIRLKKYMNDNGYSGNVINRANINEPTN